MSGKIIKSQCRGCGSTFEEVEENYSSQCDYCGTLKEKPEVSKCEQCGGSLEYDPSSQSLKCPFCSSQQALVQDEDALPSQADKILPLAVDQKALLAAVEDWMISGDYTLDDLITAGEITKLEMRYEPVYWFEGDYTADWSASFGYDHQEQYTDLEKRYNKALKRHVDVPVIRTRIRTDWTPISGVLNGKYSFLKYAGKVENQKLLSFIESASFADSTNFSPGFLVSVPAVSFTFTEKQLEEKSHSHINAVVRESVLACSKGDKNKDWNWSTRTNQSHTSSLLIPICVAQVEYKNKVYEAYFDGRDLQRAIYDPLPIDEESWNRAAAIKSKCARALKSARWANALSLILGLVLLIAAPAIFSPKIAAYWEGNFLLYALILLSLYAFSRIRASKIDSYWNHYVSQLISDSKSRRADALVARRAGPTGGMDAHPSPMQASSTNVPFLAAIDGSIGLLAKTVLAALSVILLVMMTEILIAPAGGANLTAQPSSAQSSVNRNDSSDVDSMRTQTMPSSIHEKGTEEATEQDKPNPQVSAEQTGTELSGDKSATVPQSLPPGVTSTGAASANAGSASAMAAQNTLTQSTSPQNSSQPVVSTTSGNQPEASAQSDYPPTSLRQANLLSQEGKYEQAIPILGQLCSLTSNSFPSIRSAACASLGQIYQNGQGVAPDLQKAEGYYQKACSGGLTEACTQAQSLANSSTQ